MLIEAKTAQYAGIDHQELISGDAADRVIRGTILVDVIVIEDTGTSADGQMKVSFEGVDFFDGSSTSGGFDFSVPTGSLTVEALAGADWKVVTST